MRKLTVYFASLVCFLNFFCLFYIFKKYTQTFFISLKIVTSQKHEVTETHSKVGAFNGVQKILNPSSKKSPIDGVRVFNVLRSQDFSVYLPSPSAPSIGVYFKLVLKTFIARILKQFVSKFSKNRQ